jgi:succinyl-CoA synthetase beta subunit
LQTSASLKFTVLNPKGRIWTMVAGGGASVIYADTVSLNFLQTLLQVLCTFLYLLMLMPDLS